MKKPINKLLILLACASFCTGCASNDTKQVNEPNSEIIAEIVEVTSEASTKAEETTKNNEFSQIESEELYAETNDADDYEYLKASFKEKDGNLILTIPSEMFSEEHTYIFKDGTMVDTQIKLIPTDDISFENMCKEAALEGIKNEFAIDGNGNYVANVGIDGVDEEYRKFDKTKEFLNESVSTYNAYLTIMGNLKEEYVENNEVIFEGFYSVNAKYVPKSEENSNNAIFVDIKTKNPEYDVSKNEPLQISGILNEDRAKFELVNTSAKNGVVTWTYSLTVNNKDECKELSVFIENKLYSFTYDDMVVDEG